MTTLWKGGTDVNFPLLGRALGCPEISPAHTEVDST